MFVQRGQDPDGKLGSAAALGQLDQRVQVVTRVAGEPSRQRQREAGADELSAPPGEDLRVLGLSTVRYTHVSLVRPAAYVLPRGRKSSGGVPPPPPAAQEAA